MKDLTLVPLGGLCNRLRALVSARCLLSYDPALRIQVVWAAKAECAARFDELFEDNLTIAGRFAFRSAGFLDALPYCAAICVYLLCCVAFGMMDNMLIFIRRRLLLSVSRTFAQRNGSIFLPARPYVPPPRQSGAS